MDNLSNISGLSNNYIENAVKASDKINAIKRNSGEKATDEEMMKACKEFETYLLEQVMKEVTKTVDIFGTGDIEIVRSGCEFGKERRNLFSGKRDHFSLLFGKIWLE